MNKKRILRDLANINSCPLDNCSVSPEEDNIYHWTGLLIGLKDTPYENGLFKLELILPSNYPYSPPTVRFITRIYHPNIDKKGNVCLDILKEEWTSCLSISTVLLSVISLLDNPNTRNPYNIEAADLYEKDINKYLEKTKKYTLKYAKI